MSELVIMPKADWQATLDATRAKTGKSDLIKSGELANEIATIETGGGAAEILASGSCGDSVQWAVRSDHSLEITGTGAMTDYSYSNKAPWATDYGEFITLIRVGEGVTHIGAYAFNTTMTTMFLYIPSTVTSYGSYAVRAVRHLYIEDLAEYCKHDYNYDSSPVQHATYLYFNGEPVTSELVISNTTRIGNYAFYSCKAFTNVTILEGVTEIGKNAFNGCSKFTGKLTLPSSLQTIRAEAFRGAAYTSVYITDLAAFAQIDCEDSWGAPLHANAKLYVNNALITTLQIPTTCTKIGNYIFWTDSDYKNSSQFTSVTIPSSVVSIGKNAFQYNGKLTSATFSDPNGWYVTTTKGASSGTTVTLTNASTAATNLVSTYGNGYYWYNT